MTGRAPLADYYVEYLRRRDARSAGALAEALQPSQPLEARMLAAHAMQGPHAFSIDDGPWQGVEAWVGPQLPAATNASRIWFDTCEISTMALVPREPPAADWDPEAVRRWIPFDGWLSLRPVTVWQFRAYLEMVVKTLRLDVPGAPTTGWVPYDPARILEGGGEGASDTRPVTSVTASEAKAFANWMGKSLPAHRTWEDVPLLRPDAVGMLWGGVKKEWIGYPEPDDDEATAISPATIGGILSEERDLEEPPPPERRMIYRYNDWSRSFGFRTFVYSEFGLEGKKSNPAAYQR